MTQNKIILALCALCFYTTIVAQEAPKEEPKFGIQFSGFVKSDVFYDTRQTFAAREGHFLLYPMPENLDAQKKDLNANAGFNMLPVESRLSGKISGPDAFGAKTSGLMEVDFFGQLETNSNLLRMRHAYVKLNWTSRELLLGQFWHALFIPQCFPATVSFNTGAPINPFARNPQIRFTQQLGNFKFLAIAQAQREYSSYGPVGYSSIYLRNSSLPDINGQIHYGKTSEGGKELYAGLGAGYKILRPNLAVTKTVESFHTLAFVKFANAKFTAKAAGIYGNNLSDALMLGGYAIADTNTSSYTSLGVSSAWIDLHTNGKKIQVGLFAGYTEMLGSSSNITGAYYSRELASTKGYIRSLQRIAPRIAFISGKTKFAFELEYTMAQFGKPNAKGIVMNTKDIANIRGLIGVYYYF